MITQEFYPIVSNNLSKGFPELRHHILSNYTRSCSIKKGTEVLFETPDDWIYLVKGKIKAFFYDTYGHEQILYLFIKDSLIFQPDTNQFYKRLVTYESSSIYYINKYSIFEFLQQDVSYMDKYITIISSRYNVLMQQILTTNHQSALQKVLIFILFLARKFGEQNPDGTITINKVLSLTDIGALTSVHRTNVSAYVNELERLHIIERKKQLLIIRDIAALQQLIEESENS